MKRINFLPLVLTAAALMSCSDDKTVDQIIDIDPDPEVAKSEEYYAGGKLGTTTLQNAYAYRQAAPAVDDAGMTAAFQIGESLFEKDYNTNTSGDAAFSGLGPVYVRRGCLYCHPNYGSTAAVCGIPATE